MNQPVKKFRAKNISLSIWRDESTDKGRTVTRHNVKFQKRYFDQQSQSWKDTDCFFVDDLPRLRLVVEQAFEFILLRENDGRPENEP